MPASPRVSARAIRFTVLERPFASSKENILLTMGLGTHVWVIGLLARRNDDMLSS